MLININKYLNNTHKIHKVNGFTLLEAVIAIAISILVFGGLTILGVNSVKTAKFEEHLINLNALVEQKSSALFNNITNELAKFPTGATQVGSINVDSPVTGYYDLLNESGCIVSTTTLDGLGNRVLDCSGSIVGKPSNDLTARFRRQWSVKKDFPSPGDVTVALVVVYQQTNQIVKSTYITKSDNVTTK
jgi:type II secretory pathway pseudopilin PulG